MWVMLLPARGEVDPQQVGDGARVRLSVRKARPQRRLSKLPLGLVLRVLLSDSVKTFPAVLGEYCLKQPPGVTKVTTKLRAQEPGYVMHYAAVCLHAQVLRHHYS